MPLGFTQVAVQVTQATGAANLHDAGNRHRTANRAELALLAVFRFRTPWNQARHLRPVKRQRSPDERGFVAGNQRKISVKQRSRHLFQLLR
ncbi:hypothetical protein D3C75_868530 [compost metagenome]